MHKVAQSLHRRLLGIERGESGAADGELWQVFVEERGDEGAVWDYGRCQSLRLQFLFWKNSTDGL
jgi:hypothetical protein